MTVEVSKTIRCHCGRLLVFLGDTSHGKPPTEVKNEYRNVPGLAFFTSADGDLVACSRCGRPHRARYWSYQV